MSAKFNLKVLVNKDKTKVLFAEIDSDFANVLLSFLTLPLGTILRIFDEHYGDEEVPIVLGSLNSLRKGLSDLDDVYFCTKEGKTMLLNPIRSSESECNKLKLNIDYESQPTKYFGCENMDCYLGVSSGIRLYFDTAICKCGKPMNREVRGRRIHSEAANNENGVFSKKNVSFVISDDLQIAPNVTESVIQIIRNFGITDVDGAEQMDLTIGLNEIMDLLKGSLKSKTPLTDLVLNKRPIYHLMKFESTTSMCKMEEESNAQKIVIKAIIQRSTKKLLFAIAKENFIDFLFSLLTIPLGGVVKLLGINSPLGNINNLYSSIQNMDGDDCLNTTNTKSMLLKPQLAPMYLSKYQILPLVEQNPPLLYFHPHLDHDKNSFWSFMHNIFDRIVSFKDPKGEGSYVKGPGMFMVADDLTVTPLSMLSSVSILSGLRVPLSDFEEKEFEIGLQEALNILRASLVSTCALTDGLRINCVFMKNPKEEKRI